MQSIYRSSGAQSPRNGIFANSRHVLPTVERKTSNHLKLRFLEDLDEIQKIEYFGRLRRFGLFASDIHKTTSGQTDSILRSDPKAKPQRVRRRKTSKRSSKPLN